MTDSLRLMWIAGLVWLLVRQVRPRRVARFPTVSIMLIVLGVAQCTPFLEHHSLGAAAAGVLIASFVVGLGLAVIRGFLIRLWVEAGEVWRRGTWLTLVLWLAALGSHLGSDRLVEHRGRPVGASSATILLYVGASLVAQTLIVRHRARDLLNNSGSAPNERRVPRATARSCAHPYPKRRRALPVTSLGLRRSNRNWLGR